MLSYIQNNTNLLLFIIFILALLKVIDIIYTNYNFSSLSYIKTLMRQAARYSSAAKQDENPLIALLHANYGAGYLWATIDVASVEDIKSIYPEFIKIRKDILDTQDNITKNIVRMYPNLNTQNDLLATLAGEA